MIGTLAIVVSAERLLSIGSQVLLPMRKDTSYPVLFEAEVGAGRGASSTGLEGTVGDGPYSKSAS
jgi:hypothetical protein